MIGSQIRPQQWVKQDIMHMMAAVLGDREMVITLHKHSLKQETREYTETMTQQHASTGYDRCTPHMLYVVPSCTFKNHRYGEMDPWWI